MSAESGQIRLEGGYAKSLIISETDRTTTLPPIHLIGFFSGGNVSFYMTADEARAVIAQLQSVIGKVDNVHSVS